MAKRCNLTETNDPKRKLEETVFKNGDWLQKSTATAGTVEPLNPGEPIMGLCIEDVRASDDNFDTNDRIAVDVQWNEEDRAEMEVTGGTASVDIEGNSFDVSAGDSAVLNIAAPGTQFKVTRFISETLVEVQPMLFKEDLLV